MSLRFSSRHGLTSVAVAICSSACANIVGLTALHDGNCTPGSTQECPYSGPAGTKDVGTCKAGIQTCAADGQSWGACFGEVLPMPMQDCTKAVDVTCGQISRALCCTPPATMSCYTGPAGTEGVGNCKGGMLTCSATTDAWSSCAGEVLPAQEDCYQMGDENCDGNACSDPVWDLAFDDAGGEQPTSMAVDSKGDVYLAGYFTGTIGVNGKMFSVAHPGHQQYYLIKISGQAPHDMLWYKLIGDGNDNGGNIRVTVGKNDDVIVAGDLYSAADFGGGTMAAPTGQDAAFVAKYDAQGTYQWSHIFGNAGGAFATTVAADAQGDVILAGTWFGGTLDFGTTQLPGSAGPGFIAKLTSSSGESVWSTGLSTASDIAVAVSPSDVNGVFVTGDFMNTLNLGGNMYTSSGQRDVFLAKLDGTGNIVGSAAYGSPGNEYSSSIGVSSNGSVAISGIYGGPINFGTGTLTSSDGTAFIALFDTSLKPGWNRGFAGVNPSYVALDSKGDVFLTTAVSGTVNFGAQNLTSVGAYSIALVKFSPMQAVLWNKLFATQNVVTSDIALDPSTGNVAITGTFTGSLSFGLPPLAGMSNQYLAEFQY